MDAGYSGTPQAKKLGIGPGVRWDVVAASDDWNFEAEPDAASRVTGTAPTDMVVVFIREANAIVPAIERQRDRIFPAGALWLAWPRTAGGHRSDVTENAIRAAALDRGLVDVKVAAIDQDWSGLKLVWRKENRT